MRALVVAGAVFLAFQSSTAPKSGGNPDAAKIKNPVPSTRESLAAGRRAYHLLCEKCHGPEGKGDGTAATGTKQPSDLTGTKWEYGGSDGEIFSVVHDGTSLDMEGYSARLSDAEIWNIVNYVRSLRSDKP